MGKRIFAGVLILTLMMFSGHDRSSITGGPFESKHIAYYRHFKPDGLDSILTAYNTYLEQAVEKHVSPGAAVAIVYKGQILLLRGYGIRREGDSSSVNAHTVFRLGSVSKGFAAVLTGIFVHAGCLSWDDPIKRYLPDFTMKDTASANEVTIRQILSQTSGFPTHTFTDLLDDGESFEDIKGSLANVDLVAKPGTVYSYQNVVYSLIGDILHNITGSTYQELLKKRIFDPVAMQDASTDFISFKDNPNTAFPHLFIHQTWRPRIKNDRYYSDAPASGINASASDMAHWLLGLTGYYPDVVTPDIVQDISSPNIQTPRKYAYRVNWKSLEKAYYGLGWRVFQYDHRNVIYHGGYVEGFRSEVAFDPDEGIGIALLFNSNTSFASQCIPYFLDQFYHLKRPENDPNMLAVNY